MTDARRPPFPLAGWMLERHRVYRKRQDGDPWPWSPDPIFQRLHFCNVYRELDTVTAWVRENIREPYSDSPHLWFLLAVARFFNEPDTIKWLLYDGGLPRERSDTFHPDWAIMTLQNLSALRRRIWRPAYMFRSDGGSKIHYTINRVLNGVWEARAELAPRLYQTSLREATYALNEHYGWAGFMSYEVVTDLRHTSWLNAAPDIDTFANVGPGALRGLNRLDGRPLKDRLPQDLALGRMRELLEWMRGHWPSGWPRLELRDIEHSLCEYDKYERAREGTGAPRLYHPQGRTTP